MGKYCKWSGAHKKSKWQRGFGLTTPLLTNSNGDKMGKTADGAIWLNDDLLSAYDYWQFGET